jgi:hypothetical protein
VKIAAESKGITLMDKAVETPRKRQINWTNVLTVGSAAILIGAEVFGAAFAGGWAVAHIMLGSFFAFLGLGTYGVQITQAVFFVIGMAIMVSFVRGAQRIEPFFTDK